MFIRIILPHTTHSEPLHHPDIWKLEYVTPVPKVYPPEKLSDLRRISGLLNLSKITDKIIAEIIAADMQKSRDRAQYGNVKKVSLQHYLVKMLNRILVSIDQNSIKESMAVILQMVDWKQAFDRQSHKLGIQSFIENGVKTFNDLSILEILNLLSIANYNFQQHVG